MTPDRRSVSLDVFRGLTVCLMIVVNCAGSHSHVFGPLGHADWHGFTLADLIFPSFLFAVGNALSFVESKWDRMTRLEVVTKIFKRTAIIFLLGYLFGWLPFASYNADHELVYKPFAETRIMGVLQRIALAYCLAALLLYFLKPRLTAIVTALLLLLYWALLLALGEAPGPLSITGNAGHQFDVWLMGANHLYRGEGVPFDPEGWLSTLPAVGNVVGGYFVGRYIQQRGRTVIGLLHVFVVGCALVTAACFWDLAFPINKKLWTSSFVLLTVGLDCVILAPMAYLVDLVHPTRWTRFLEIFGKNPLFIYLLADVVSTILGFVRVDRETSLQRWLYQHVFSVVGDKLGSLLFAICVMLVCWLAGWWLDRRKIYIRV